MAVNIRIGIPEPPAYITEALNYPGVRFVSDCGKRRKETKPCAKAEAKLSRPCALLCKCMCEYERRGREWRGKRTKRGRASSHTHRHKQTYWCPPEIGRSMVLPFPHGCNTWNILQASSLFLYHTHLPSLYEHKSSSLLVCSPGTKWSACQP